MATEEPAPRKSAALRIEELAPFLCACIAFAVFLHYSSFVALKFAVGDWKNGALYAAIFDWSAIQTGFSFGVYGFIVGKTDGFIAEVRGTKAMSRFMGYIRRANVIGFVLTVASIPLIITEPSIGEPLSTWYVIVAVWFCLFIWSFLSFLRLAFNFGRLAGVKDKVFHGA